jgi:hypothetical protein
MKRTSLPIANMVLGEIGLTSKETWGDERSVWSAELGKQLVTVRVTALDVSRGRRQSVTKAESVSVVKHTINLQFGN